MATGDSNSEFDDNKTGEYPTLPVSVQSGSFPIKRKTDKTGQFPAAGVDLKKGVGPKKDRPDTNDYPAIADDTKLQLEENGRHKKYKKLADKNQERGKFEAAPAAWRKLSISPSKRTVPSIFRSPWIWRISALCSIACTVQTRPRP